MTTALRSLNSRVALLVAICSFVLLLTAWSHGSDSPAAPPRCSAADENLSIERGGYLRWCGPARAVIYLRGKTYRIRGGFCTPLRWTRLKTPRRFFDGVATGFIARKNGVPSLAFSFWWPTPITHAQVVTINDSLIVVPGTSVNGSGTVVVGQRLNGGRFSLYGRDASGATARVRGSWTCG